ncbi:hypothetical protein [Streptomyces sp. SJL17-4]
MEGPSLVGTADVAVRPSAVIRTTAALSSAEGPTTSSASPLRTQAMA